MSVWGVGGAQPGPEHWAASRGTAPGKGTRSDMVAVGQQRLGATNRWDTEMTQVGVSVRKEPFSPTLHRQVSGESAPRGPDTGRHGDTATSGLRP